MAESAIKPGMMIVVVFNTEKNTPCFYLVNFKDNTPKIIEEMNVESPSKDTKLGG